MIQIMKDVPENMVGFWASQSITQEDFTLQIAPAMQESIAKHGKLNSLLVLDPSIVGKGVDNWWGETLLGLRNLSDWHRIAIVSDSEDIRDFTYLFSLVSKGEFKSFPYDGLYSAIDWVSEKDFHTI